MVLPLVLVAGSGFMAMRDIASKYDGLVQEVERLNRSAMKLQGSLSDEGQAVTTYLLTYSDQQKDEFQRARQGTDAALVELASLLADADGQERLAAVERAMVEFRSAAAPVFERDDFTEGQRVVLVTRSLYEPQVKLRDAAADLLDYAATRTVLVRQQADAAVWRANLINGGVALGGLLVAVVWALVLSRSITRPVTAISDAFGRLSTGDLTLSDLEVTTTDEVGQMAEAFNRMLADHRRFLLQIRETSDALAGSSGEINRIVQQAVGATGQIATAIQEVAAGANDQAQQSEDTVRAVEQLREAINQIAQGALRQAEYVQRASQLLAGTAEGIEHARSAAVEVNNAAQQALQSAQQGGQAVEEALAAMTSIEQATERVAARISGLGDQSQRIGEIVQLIDGIAEQTNLLALNAAIEAARAGEHGKGFAVVADEVRKLAEHSQEATAEIAQLVASIRESVDQTVNAMMATAQEVQKGSTLASQAGQELKQILSALVLTHEKAAGIQTATERVAGETTAAVTAMDEVAGVTEENTAATTQMTTASDQVSNAIHRVAAVAEETAASAQEVSASSEQVSASVEHIGVSIGRLEELAQDLRHLVDHFRLEGPDPAPEAEAQAEGGAVALSSLS